MAAPGATTVDPDSTLHIIIPEDAVLPGDAPRRLGQYELLEEIARGGMGIIYKARHTGLDAIVAVKLIRSGLLATSTDVERFRREARAAAKLRHPNIVNVHDIGEQDGQHYFSMDYVPGANLAELARTRPFSPKQAAEITRAVAVAIHHAHVQGVLHRDIKPSNVILTPEQVAKVLDFGLARISTDDMQLTQSGTPMGSPCYMPPEQCGFGEKDEVRRQKAEAGPPSEASAKEGSQERTRSQPCDANRQSAINNRKSPVGPWSDVYGLGAMLYELLTGRPPFQAPTVVETLRLVVESDPVLPRLFNRSLPVDLETICLKCLEKEPAKRYASAEGLAEDLVRFLADQPIRARRVTQAERAWRWCKRNPVVASLSAATVLLVLAVAIGGPVAVFRINRARQAERLQWVQAQKNLYAADMLLAQQALSNHELGRARQLLERHVPKFDQPDLRGWEWRYLSGRSRSHELFTLTKRPTYVNHLRFTPNGDYLLTIDSEFVLQAWNVVERRELARTIVRNAIGMMTVSPDSQIVAVQCWTARRPAVRRYELPTLREVGQPLAHEHWIEAMCFNPESGHLLTAGGRSVQEWDIDRETIVRTIPLPDGLRGTRFEAFSPDGQRIAVVQTNGIVLWDLRTPRQIARIPGSWKEGLDAQGMTYSRDGRFLTIGHYDSTARVYSTETGERIATLQGHRAWIWAMKFTSDGKTLVTASFDQQLRLWNTTTWTEIGRLQGHLDEIRTVDISSNDQMIVTGGKDATIRVWPLAGAMPATNHYVFPQKPEVIDFSPDGNRFIAVSMRTAFLGRSVPPRIEREMSLLIDQEIALGLSPDGNLIAAGHGSSVRLFDSATGQEIAEWEAGRGRVERIAFSPSGRLVASSTTEGTLKICDPRSREPTKQIQVDGLAHGWGASTLRFSPNADLVAVGEKRSFVTSLWSTFDGKRVAAYSGHRMLVADVAFSADGQRLATGSHDGTARVWELKTGALVGEFRSQLQGVESVALSPDGSRLVFGNVDAPVKVFDVGSGQELAALPGPGSSGCFRIFFVDADTILGASGRLGISDTEITVWRAPRLLEFETANTRN